MYISHMRSEGAEIVQAVEELIAIARGSGIRAEIYHLKTVVVPGELAQNGPGGCAGREGPFGTVHHGRHLYVPGRATGLDSTMPPWVQEGGFVAFLKRLKDPATRKRIAAEMRVSSSSWENMFLEPGSPDGILLVGFKSEKLKAADGQEPG